MIRIKELRIGNKVAGTGLHEGRVLTINMMEHFQDEGFVLFFKEHDEGEYLQDCLPIPLTPEILQEAGFTRKTLGPILYYCKGYNPVTRDPMITLEWSEKMGCFFFNNAGHPIRYVHQLQNLYLLLAGEELEMGSLTHYLFLEGKGLEALTN